MPYPGLLHPEPLPHSSPLLTRTSAGDTQTQFWLSLCGVSASWWAQGLFEPSVCLWQVWGLILNVILPLLQSFWGFSFALGCRVSPQSHCSTAQLPLQLHTAAVPMPTIMLGHLCPSMWGISSQLLQCQVQE